MAAPRVKYVVEVVDKASASFKRMGAAAGKLATQFAAAGAAAAGAAIVKFTKDATVTADEIGKLSTQLGISTEALSEFRFIAGQTGVEFKQFALGVQRAGRRVSEAAIGTGEAQGALKELGIDAVKLTKIPLDKQFLIIADAMNQVEGDTNQLRLAMKLFDTEGVKLLRTIKAGGPELRRLGERAHELGVVFDEDLTEQAAETVDAFDDLKNAWIGLGAEFARNSVAEDTAGFFAGLTIRAKDTLRVFRELGGGSSGLEGALLHMFGAVDNASLGLDQMRESARASADATNAASAAINNFNNVQLKAEEIEPVYISSEALAAFDQVLRDIETPLEAYQERLQLLKFLHDEVGLSAEDYGKAIQLAGKELAAATTAGDGFADVTSKSAQAFDAVEDAATRAVGNLVEGFAKGTADIGDLFTNLATAVIEDLFRIYVVQQIVDSVSSAFGAPPSGRHLGGPVFAGQPYKVGERGPELFVPQGSGSIVPNGAGVPAVNFTINSLDPKTAASVIVENKNVIIGVIQSAYERGGQPSPLR